MRRSIGLFLVALLPLAACSGQADDGEGAGNTRTVQHVKGETQIPAAPQRVVTLWAPTLSAMVALDEPPVGYAFNEEPIHGVDVPEGYDIGQMKHVGHSQELDLEKVAGVSPDLIIATDLHEEVYDQLSGIAPTVVLRWPGSSGWKQHLTDVAEVLQLRDKADEAVAEYDARVAEVAEAVGDPGGTEVSVVRFHTEELRLEVRNSFAGQIVADVGFSRPAAQDVAEEGSGFVPISLERLPEADGDAMFAYTIADGDEDKPNLLERARQNPLWGNLEAVRNDQVHPVDYKTWIANNYIAAQAVLDDLEEAFE
ncbi:iron complex transport system substrate-binding protein [Amycolatopsis marina]|uniref:Iron complex transport system substrate-binding protein n=1 Tax=Amycolatopsis marina TaxID=490629 RepID=A0A1I1AR05_9PSEU|nr:iron-siderophore ABC transporter substrate-binding protein [Amycolatopsis marina]SFB40347.1 iron complex transport system substrate-binding protein [Amycolatopsis marina]